MVELGRLRIGPEVVDVQHGDLPAAQAPRVGDLEQGCVAERRQPALTACIPRSFDLVVGQVDSRCNSGLVSARRTGLPS
jgi:hypothetical protein